MSFHWGIMGAGNIASKFADAVRRLAGCEVIAVASRDGARAEEFAWQNGIPHACVGYETLLTGRMRSTSRPGRTAMRR